MKRRILNIKKFQKIKNTTINKLVNKFVKSNEGIKVDVGEPRFKTNQWQVDQ